MFTIGLCAGVATLFSACGLLEELPPVPTETPANYNFLANPGFEVDGAPWRTLDSPAWGPFEISEGVAHTGDHSLGLSLNGGPGETATRIVGGVQDTTPFEFPEFVSGFYRVDRWEPVATFQYLQFVVIVRGGDFGDEFALHEIRFPIAGAPRQPFELSNARFVFLSRDAPVMNRWTYFSYPIKQAFEERWGRVPERWDSIETIFEVRYDAKTEEQSPTGAQVYFDDLYMGRQAFNPNKPADFD